VHPFIGNTFGPLIFMICVLGGLGNMIGGFIAAFIISQIIAIGGYYFSTELSRLGVNGMHPVMLLDRRSTEQ
jgi:branched-chain amino acid transport system permease protein